MQQAGMELEKKQAVETKSAEQPGASSRAASPAKMEKEIHSEEKWNLERNVRSRSRPPMDEVPRSYNAVQELDGFPSGPEGTDAELRRIQY